MKADPVRNMNYLVGGDNYRNKTRVNQAPGGNTSLSLGWGDSSPYEHRRGRFDPQPVHNYGLNNSLESPQKFASLRDQGPYQQPEFKNTFSGFSALQESRKAKLKPLDDPFKRSWNDGQNFMGSNTLNGARSPMENAYMKHKFTEGPTYDEHRGYEAGNNYQHANTTTHYQASQYENPNPARTQLRSRSQISSIQNNYRNIMNDFSNTRGPMESTKNSFSPQFRATADASDKWSGIRVTNPPGGGSSFKLWG